MGVHIRQFVPIMYGVERETETMTTATDIARAIETKTDARFILQYGPYQASSLTQLAESIARKSRIRIGTELKADGSTVPSGRPRKRHMANVVLASILESLGMEVERETFVSPFYR